jgi:2-polyprenyl-6-methoxyphenol hydroxylase-like FAD-dependent oxidoreductase
MNVLISGAGIAGPALAFWLTRRGLRPVVVERAPALRVGGHAIDIRGVAVDVVEQMGLMAAVRAARTRIRKAADRHRRSTCAAMRLFPLLQRLGVGFGSKLERASRAIDLTPLETHR